MEYPGSKGCEWSSSVEALARRSAIIGAVACARRRTIDSSECKLLTQRSLLSLFLSYRSLVRTTRLERITFFLPFRYDRSAKLTPLRIFKLMWRLIVHNLFTFFFLNNRFLFTLQKIQNQQNKGRKKAIIYG